MDVSLLNKNCIKIKGKKAAFIIDPTKDITKTTGDAVIVFNNLDVDPLRVSESRVIINGPGEYEVSEVKISGARTENGIIYKLSIDGLYVILGKSLDFSKLEGSFTTCDVAILFADSKLSEAFVTALSPKIAVLYGDKKNEGAKILGLENVSPVSKVTITKDKLPEKMEVDVLN